LCWEKEYAIEKFLPLLTRWHLMYDNNFQANVLMNEIVKKRVNKGIKCYEIKWNNYETTTTEPQTAVLLRYPIKVSIYEERFSNKTQKSNLYCSTID
jgi:hypothetical protein